MKTYTTKYGELKGITSSLNYASGALKSCMVNQENCLPTPVGVLIPQYSPATFGERQKKYRSSLDFFENGQIKSAALDKQIEIQTPIGPMKAELVTFYKDGNINRVFPLNGLIDGYWSEANEREIAEVLDFDLSCGQIHAKVIAIHFYPSGALKSLTLWPGEGMSLETPLGPIACRAGVSLYENGALRSVEPASAVELPTPLGLIKAYDPEIIGMHADQNSLQFDEDGALTAITTIHTGIHVVGPIGNEIDIEPYEAPSNIDPEQLRTVPMKISVTEGNVHIQARSEYTFNLSEYQFATFDHKRVLRAACVGCPEDETCCQNGGEGVGESGGCGSCGGCG
jgi:antitoxin component YwqK of YwqJK toxin-antitoxin module